MTDQGNEPTPSPSLSYPLLHGYAVTPPPKSQSLFLHLGCGLDCETSSVHQDRVVVSEYYQDPACISGPLLVPLTLLLFCHHCEKETPRLACWSCDKDERHGEQNGPSEAQPRADTLNDPTCIKEPSDQPSASRLSPAGPLSQELL